MSVSARKLRAVFAIYIQDGLAYRASGFIWTLTDLSTAVTMPLVWAAAARGGPIQGFTAGQFVLYYLCLLLLSSFITSHFMWEIGWEIKEGLFSNYLVRPISYMQFMFMRNLAWRIVRTSIFLPIFILLLLAYWSYIRDAQLYLGWQFWTAVLLGHLVSFTFVMAMGMLALFVQEATSIFELYYIPMLFLSGQLFPISMLPAWAKTLALIFPFYYTTGLPTEILVGRLAPNAALPLIGGQVLWLGISYTLHKVLWKYGLRQYSGIGM